LRRSPVDGALGLYVPVISFAAWTAVGSLLLALKIQS
jgi:hypothetical protein